MIDALVEIAKEIQPCSVRALAYQLFNRKLIPSMALENTRNVSRLSVIAREEGRLPWDWIVDSTRTEQSLPTWADPMDYAKSVQWSYRKNKWTDQPKHISVWSEKATVEGTIRPVLEKYEVPFQVLHGWSGATPVWDAAQANLNRGQPGLILYIGDFDPSGMGMSELDLPKRLARYSSDDASNKDVDLAWAKRMLREARLEIRRVALTADDTAALGPATRFPASSKKGDDKKKGDTRYPWFIEKHGHWCWELDAMSPAALRERLEETILAELDATAWDRWSLVEELERKAIFDVCQQFGSISVLDQKFSRPVRRRKKRAPQGPSPADYGPDGVPIKLSDGSVVMVAPEDRREAESLQIRAYIERWSVARIRKNLEALKRRRLRWNRAQERASNLEQDQK
jgi:hypothetical protein